MRTRFLNIDLDIVGENNLAPLLDALEPAAYVLNPGPEPLATLELNEQERSVDDALAVFCAALEALPPDARAVWDACTKRVFNIGIESADEPYASEFNISAANVGRVAGLGAAITVTVYGAKLSRENAGVS